MKSLSLLLTIALLTACGNERTVPGAPASSIAMELHGVHAVIEVRIDGTPARMVLDTGADQNVLTPLAAEALGLEALVAGVPGSGASGSYTAAATRIGELAVGGVRQRNQVAYIVPMPEEFAYDGVLGTPFFAEFVATLDYEHRLFSVRERSRFEAPDAAERVPLRIEAGKALISTTAAGVSGWYIVDTGAGNALTFFTPAVEANALRANLQPSIRTITGVSPGGYTYGDLVRIPDLAIGGRTFGGVIAELSRAEQGTFANPRYVGNLGGEIWRRFTVTLDYPARIMYLVPNAAAAESFVGPRSGLVPSLVSGTIEVIDVVAGSPAEETGVSVGDRIVTLNGVALDVQGIESLSAALRGAPGTQVSLGLRNAVGSQRTVTLVLRELL